jgi:hypothetical protein
MSYIPFRRSKSASARKEESKPVQDEREGLYDDAEGRNLDFK